MGDCALFALFPSLSVYRLEENTVKINAKEKITNLYKLLQGEMWGQTSHLLWENKTDLGEVTFNNKTLLPWPVVCINAT